MSFLTALTKQEVSSGLQIARGTGEKTEKALRYKCCKDTLSGFRFLKFSVNPGMGHFIVSHDRVKQTAQSARDQDLLTTLLRFTCDLHVKVSEVTVHMTPQACTSAGMGYFWDLSSPGKVLEPSGAEVWDTNLDKAISLGLADSNSIILDHRPVVTADRSQGHEHCINYTRMGL